MQHRESGESKHGASSRGVKTCGDGAVLEEGDPRPSSHKP